MMAKTKATFGWILGLVLVAGLTAGGWQYTMAKTQTAPYSVTRQDGDFELRRYPTLVIAETETTGTREKASNEAFRILAGYIFGGNDTQAKIAMTAPVFEEALPPKSSQPVTADAADVRVWRMRFVMPENYSLTALPTTQDSRIRFISLPERSVISVRFSGIGHDTVLSDQTDRLKAYAQSKQIVLHGEPIYAFYNSPMTLPFLRRNEVMFEVKAP